MHPILEPKLKGKLLFSGYILPRLIRDKLYPERKGFFSLRMKIRLLRIASEEQPGNYLQENGLAVTISCYQKRMKQTTVLDNSYHHNFITENAYPVYGLMSISSIMFR